MHNSKGKDGGKGGESLKDDPPARAMARKPPLVSANFRKANAAEVSSKLQTLGGKTWNDFVSRKLALPEELFVWDNGLFLYYSSDEKFDIVNILDALMSGKPLPEKLPDYAMALNETPSTLYFTMVDKKKHIVVREELSCLHDQPSEEKGWMKVFAAIKRAEEESKNSFGIVVLDCGRLLPS